MDLAIAIGFASTGLTLLGSVVLFVIDRYLKRKAEAFDRRRRLLERVLDALGRSAKAATRPAILRAHLDADIEVAMLIPRLLLEVDAEDRVVAQWMQRRLQVTLAARDPRERVEANGHTATVLLRWHHGDLSRDWFEESLSRDPLIAGFKVPARTRVRQYAREAGSSAGLLIVLLALVGLIRNVVWPRSRRPYSANVVPRWAR